jgi:hypothetical protein
MNPLLAMARVVHVTEPNQTPPSLFNVPEDSRALGNKLADKQGKRMHDGVQSATHRCCLAGPVAELLSSAT